MKKIERFEKALNAKRYNWLLKNINNNYSYYNDPIKAFFDDAERYIKAIKEDRVICSIASVSKSGMSRTIKFLECKKNRNTANWHNWLNFNQFFNSLGYRKARNNPDYFSISGCGMDMIFHSNYTNMHYLKSLKIINTKQCEHLAQQTPNVI